jgi:two-component system, cell cycle sensor histidine kinase and response regulator CckA
LPELLVNLRDLLGGLKSSYAELMLDSLAPQHPLRHNVDEIQKASRRGRLTRQLLAFGRKQMQALQLLDLNSILEDSNKMLPRLLGEDIALEFVPAKKLGRVKADPVQIEQVIMNLAANARDAKGRQAGYRDRERTPG